MLYPQAPQHVFLGAHEGVCSALPLMFTCLDCFGFFSETPQLSLVASCSWEGRTPSITVVTSAGSTSRARPTGRSTWMRKSPPPPDYTHGDVCRQLPPGAGLRPSPKRGGSPISIPATHPHQKKSRLKSHPKAGLFVAGRGGEAENSRRCSAKSLPLVYSLALENACCTLAKQGKTAACPSCRQGEPC